MNTTENCPVCHDQQPAPGARCACCGALGEAPTEPRTLREVCADCHAPEDKCSRSRVQRALCEWEAHNPGWDEWEPIEEEEGEFDEHDA